MPEGRSRTLLWILIGSIFVGGVHDITALVAVDFMRVSKLAVPESLSNLQRWHKAVSARPSAAA